MKYTLDVNYGSGSGNYKIELTIDPNKKYLNFSKSYKNFDTVFDSIRLDQYQLSRQMIKEIVKSIPGFLKDSEYLDDYVS